MRRWVSWLFGGAGAVIAALLFLLYTSPGHSLLAALIDRLSDGQVRITGLSGSLPGHPRAKLVEIADSGGVWLRIEDAAMDWDAFAALGSHYSIQAAAASKIAVLRRPVEESETAAATPRIDIESLHAPRIEIAKAVAGHAAVLSATGALHYVSRHDFGADLAIDQLGGAGRYRVIAAVADDVARGRAAISEDGAGVLGAVLGLPGLGAVNLRADASGDARANRVAFTLSAGALRAKGGGTIAIAQNRVDIDFDARAPAMRPSPALAWTSLTLDGHMHGTFDAPRVKGKLQVADATLSSVRAASILAEVEGDQGAVDLSGIATGLRVPGEHPDLFAAAPMAVRAHADLKTASRPVSFTVSHPLFAVDGRAETRGRTRLALNVAVPSLAPFARLADEDLRGHAAFAVETGEDQGATRFAATGRIDAEGASAIARVLGRGATFRLGASLRGADIERSEAAIQGAGLDFRANGSLRAGRLDYGVAMKLSDVSRLTHALIGSATLSGRIEGPLDTADTTVAANAIIASRGFEPRRIALTVQAKGFPSIASAHLRAEGALNDAPVFAQGDFARGGKVTLTAKWKSLAASGDVVLPASGKIRLDAGQLADLAPLIGARLSGSLSSTIALAQKKASIHAQASRLETADARLGAASVEGTIADPFGTPSLALDIAARQVSVAGLSGDARAKLSGPLRDLAISLDAPQISADARLDLGRKHLVLLRASAKWRDETAVLAAPAAFDFAKGLTVDRLAAKLGGGEFSVSGRLAPDLAARAGLRGASAKLLEPFAGTPLSGEISGDAELAGTLDEPRGTVALQARNLVAALYLPRTPVSVDAQAKLHGKAMTLDAALAAGPSARLTLAGEMPLRDGEAMKLHALGNADLAMLNPFVAAEGRRMSGALSLDADIAGSFAAPRLSGGGSLKNGELRDYAQGVRLHDIDAAFTGTGRSLRIAALTARAGPGTIGGSGSIDLAAPGAPLDVTLKVRNARPIVSDLITATLSGDLHVSGALRQKIVVAGKLDVSRGTINIPDRFPPEVAVLDVRRKGAQAPPAPSGGSIALDVQLATSGPIFVRGRGIDADMGGDLRLGGTLAAPIATGGFDMNRGTVSLAGQTLTFTAGKLSFDGAGIRGRIDPALNLSAQTNSGGVTATLAVTGHASQPRIVLSSAPSLPQDEVLAHLFFQQSAKQLTPLQLAQIAQAIASLGGIGGGFDPLGALRRGLKLDRLSVGSTTGGASGSETQTTVEGGKYVARNVYVGARQSLAGGTQVQVQVDLTKQLKAQATVSTGTNATATKGSAAQDNGSSVGLSWEFEY